MAEKVLYKVESTVGRAADLLGGAATFKRQLSSALDAHEVIVLGFPGNALVHLASKVGLIRHADSLEKAVGISIRTLQRRKKDAIPRKLSQEQSGRAWKFAEILTSASEIFGSQAEAERFLQEPALGLNQHRPIDLLSTPAGVKLVENHLERMRYGVYT